MTTQSDSFLKHFLVGVLYYTVTAIAHAGTTTFQLDTNLSVLAISGSFSGVAIQPQGAGSLTTHYTGTIAADITDSSITFGGGSAIIGMNNGSWQPLAGGAAGNAPANYGGQVFVFLVVDGKAAVRNMALDLTSSALALAAEAFPSLGLEFTFPQAGTTTLDYNYSGLIGSGSGSQPMTGTTTNTLSTNATLVVQGTDLVLTIPVDISGTATAQSPGDVMYRFRGQFVAKAPAPIPLQITSFLPSAGQLDFTIATTPGQSFTILMSTNLTDWPTVVDQFTATNNPTVRTVAIPAAALPQQYYRVRQD